MFQGMVVRAGEMIAGVVDGLDPDAVSGSAARELWSAFDRAERLCAAGKMLLARRVAATHQRSGGSRSAAEELARRGGTSAGQAAESVETSQRLPDQQPVEAALRRGQLSLPQAAAISAAAVANPAEAARLTELAGRVSLAELREECARVRAAADPDPDATHRRIHAARRLRHYTDPEGGWNLSARGTAQAGAAFLTVLNAFTDAIFRQARRHGRCEPVEAYAFDALMHLAEHAAGHCDSPPQPGDGTARTDGDTSGGHDPVGDAEATAADVAATGGVDQPVADGAGQPAGAPATAGAGHRPPGKESGLIAQPAGADPGIFAAGRSELSSGCAVRPGRSSNPRYLALLRVDVEALRRGRVQGEELCEIAGVGPVPVSTARSVLGEAIVKLVITTGVDVANVTHVGRGPTAAQRAALLWMNPSCAVEGCDRRRVEWDHQIPWAETRHTRLDELDPLCAFHHDLKTRLGYALVPGKGKRAFVGPDDARHPNHQQKSAEVATGSDAAPVAKPETRGRGPGQTVAAEPESNRGIRAPTGANRPSTAPASAAPPGKARPTRTARPAVGAQLTLPPPPAHGEQAPQPP